jgi:hypothetical protein
MATYASERRGLEVKFTTPSLVSQRCASIKPCVAWELLLLLKKGHSTIVPLANLNFKHMNGKKHVVVVIMLLIAIVFVVGADWAGPAAQRFFKSYFADIAIPFGYYFLLVLIEDKYHPFQKWYVKAIAIFTLCSVSETLQYFGIYAMATVFDPLDYAMYALGVLLAAFADRIIFTRLFRSWH